MQDDGTLLVVDMQNGSQLATVGSHSPPVAGFYVTDTTVFAFAGNQITAYDLDNFEQLNQADCDADVRAVLQVRGDCLPLYLATLHLVVALAPSLSDCSILSQLVFAHF